jgi:hypothetical protein
MYQEYWPSTMMLLLGHILVSMGTYRAHRNPMFEFTFEGALFRFNVNTPEFEPLLRLPPRMNARWCQTSPSHHS